MSNDINKIDGLPGVYSPAGKTQISSNTTTSPKSSAITLSGNLDQIATLFAEAEVPEHSTRVTQIKQQINSDTYTVDLDNLAEKLTQALLKPTNGI